MAEHLKLINPSPPPRLGFVATSVVRDIERSFRCGRDRPGDIITVIAGVSGIGKTRELVRLIQQGGAEFLHTAVATESRPFLLLDTMMRRYDLGNANNRRAVEDR